jgi:hypothetical protein
MLPFSVAAAAAAGDLSGCANVAGLGAHAISQLKQHNVPYIPHHLFCGCCRGLPVQLTVGLLWLHHPAPACCDSQCSFLLILAAAGDLSGRADVAGLGARATSQLTQQVCAATAPGIMALARQHNNQPLQVSNMKSNIVGQARDWLPGGIEFRLLADLCPCMNLCDSTTTSRCRYVKCKALLCR